MNEIITLMGNTLLCKLLASIREACWFSIIADETKNHEQLAITIGEQRPGGPCWNGTCTILTRSTLTAAIKDVLVRCRGYNSGPNYQG